MTALTSLYPDEAARAVRAEAALPGTYAEVAARSGLTEEQALAALHVLRGAGRVVLDRGVFSRATPEQLLLAGLGRGTPELRARVLAELPGNAVAIAGRLGISDWLALSVLGGLGRDGVVDCPAGSWRLRAPAAPAPDLAAAAVAVG